MKSIDSSAAGVNRCPNCGSTEINLNKKTSLLKCVYCRAEFEPEIVESDDISKLIGMHFSLGTRDIIADINEVITFKCNSCGAEVVIDASEKVYSKCHWCKSTLTIKEQIPNGAIPDVLLPFSVQKEKAQKSMKKFVKDRMFFAHSKFKKAFCTENITGVFLPYMLIDINAYAQFTGEGEHLARVLKGSIPQYNADYYKVKRTFNLVINNLTVEASSEKIQHKSAEKTNNIINSVMPFDSENCVNWNANYLKGYSSERRSINPDQIVDLVNIQAKDIARDEMRKTVIDYDRGVSWKEEILNIRGKKWRSAYFPVWLYSYQSISGKKKLLHYVAVNARTGKTMGSIPINKGKLFLITTIVQVIVLILGFLVGHILKKEGEINFVPLLCLLVGPSFFIYYYNKYRNLCARYEHEKNTKRKMTDLHSEDTFLGERKQLSDDMIKGVNHLNVSSIPKISFFHTSIARKINPSPPTTINYIKEEEVEPKNNKII